MKRFLLIICILVFFSCSQEQPKISSLYVTMVYDFQNEKDNPLVRLSTFASIASDKELYHSIQVRNVETGIYWEIFQPEFVMGNSVSYLGSSSLMFPADNILKEGKYEFIYRDMVLEKSVLEFSINEVQVENYKKIKDLTSKNLRTVLRNFPLERRVIYDETGKMVYYGLLVDEVSNYDNIIKKYPNAKTYRNYYMTKGNSEGILLPEKNISTLK